MVGGFFSRITGKWGEVLEFLGLWQPGLDMVVSGPVEVKCDDNDTNYATFCPFLLPLGEN